MLITGAGGSIGSEIARQVAECDPALLLLDHDETHLHDARRSSLDGLRRSCSPTSETAAASSRLRRRRPEVVFHAAAHKHVPLLEAHPCEAVVDEHRRHPQRRRRRGHGAASSGSCSSRPTRRCTRRASWARRSGSASRSCSLGAAGGAPFCAVRFGNVLGSRGSVIPTFVRQIAAGGPVTVTDARMTRYFMSTPEAVQLVLQARTFAQGGEVFMLEMGEPVNILDLAERMIRLSGRRVGTRHRDQHHGCGPGEKLDEELRRPTRR